METLLSVKNLEIGFIQNNQHIPVVNGIRLAINRGETLALVGESGCGKTLTALAVMGLIGKQANMPDAYLKGSIAFMEDSGQRRELLGLPQRDYDLLRGNTVSMIFQEPMTALNPLLTIGEQVAEMLIRHKNASRKEARREAVQLLSSVGIPEADKRIGDYPFQLSGGQKQRVMIAAAMACGPRLLIADEPTTALDVTIQSQILYLLKQVKETKGTSILFITHNLGIVAQFADRVAVMYRGRIVESGCVEHVLKTPLHPYTAMLLESIPRKGLHAARGDRLKAIGGMVPSPLIRLTGCPFHTRCPLAAPKCREKMPEEYHDGFSHFVSCHERGKPYWKTGTGILSRKLKS